MAVRELLLDTNAYSAFKRNVAGAVEVMRYAPLIGINTIVLGELLSGFAVGTHEEKNRQELALFLDSGRTRLIALDEHTAERYVMVYQSLKRRGKPIPVHDMWIAATALQYDLALFTYDAHFKDVDGLVIGDCLSDFVH